MVDVTYAMVIFVSGGVPVLKESQNRHHSRSSRIFILSRAYFGRISSVESH